MNWTGRRRKEEEEEEGKSHGEEMLLRLLNTAIIFVACECLNFTLTDDIATGLFLSPKSQTDELSLR